MIGDNPAFDTFLTKHRWAVLTSLRKNGHPVSSVVAYAREEDDLIVSTPGTTFKAKSLEADPRVTLCATTNAEPFNFVSVEGHASVETADLVRLTRLVFAAIADTGFQEPPDLDGWLSSQKRVIIRIRPERVYGVIR